MYVGRYATKVRSNAINSESEHLLVLIPEYHYIFQVLQHAYMYDTNQCYYLIYSHSASLCITHNVCIANSSVFIDY